MASDRARITFDPTRQYRSVLAQQGRVTLEADVNEAAAIASEALRLETIDVIGPTGAPGTGYQVISGPAAGLVGIDPGIFYLGGWRLELDAPGIPNIAQQPDWLDQPTLALVTANAVIALLVSEQSIGAIEDQTLREVALGGPDTGARTRLMQHVLQFPMTGTDCPAGAAAVNAILTADGVSVDPATLQLVPTATLQVRFVPGPTTTDPCQPAAAGGYLGADNQMVRVTVVNYDPTKNSGTLLWGWNNASMLYRAAWVNSQTLTLSPPPVDPEHAPQLNQAVEILRSSASLGQGNFIAQPQGFVTTLQQGYSATSQQIMLNDPLNSNPYQTDPQLFVRLWQAAVPFINGQPVPLDTVSGLTVTVTLTAAVPGTIALNPFWHFAVRPSMPVQVYPRRYLDAAQLPDGPRQWITDLGVVSATATGVTPGDCRVPFLPLTKLESGECCTLVLDPTKDWLGQLNAAIASAATSINVCFMAGQFNVVNKIPISGKSVKMVGAGYATQIIGATLEAVLEFDGCPQVALADLSVQAGAAGFSHGQGTNGLQGAVTIRNSDAVDIERVLLQCADGEFRTASCLAVYNPTPTADTTPQQFNVRVLNSRFIVGHYQVGVLLVNADRAQVEGNVITTPLTPRGITLENIGSHVYVVGRLRKQLLNGMTIVNTAPPVTARAQARARRRARRATALAAAVRQQAVRPGVQPAAGATPAATPEAAGGAAPAAREAVPAAAAATTPAASTRFAFVPPRINLGDVGRAHVQATYGTLALHFISSDKLGSAWKEALRGAGLSATSTAGEVHTAVNRIALTALRSPATAAPAFRNWVASVLPALYSTSGQGIVVGGDVANDIRILHNTIDGTVQGIHVGLSDLKVHPHAPHILASRVQVCGNTVNVRLTAEMTGDRHGIYVGCATSAMINDNHVALTRQDNAGQDIYGIKVAGFFGLQLLLERNCTLDFTAGIATVPDASALPPNVLWKVADNASNTQNAITWYFNQVDNVT